jgi:hypothetical protein
MGPRRTVGIVPGHRRAEAVDAGQPHGSGMQAKALPGLADRELTGSAPAALLRRKKIPPDTNIYQQAAGPTSRCDFTKTFARRDCGKIFPGVGRFSQCQVLSGRRALAAGLGN